MLTCMSSNPAHGEVYTIQHYVIKVCQRLVTGRWFFPGTLVSSTNKTDCHNIAEILLKVVLNTITITPLQSKLYTKDNEGNLKMCLL
jgi:hypothetical protein